MTSTRAVVSLQDLESETGTDGSEEEEDTKIAVSEDTTGAADASVDTEAATEAVTE